MASISATTPTVCNCCGECVVTTVTCRSRGGSPGLCGFDEFTSPSSPPKRFRKKAFGGNQANCDFANDGSHDGCSNGSGSNDNLAVSGDCQYSASTCVVTNASAYTYGLSHGGSCSHPSPTDSGLLDCDGFAPFLINQDYTFTETSTKRTWAFSGACVHYSAFWRIASGTITVELSIEDTEAAAITRLLAGAGGTWSSYSAGPCNAAWQIRTSGFSFNYTEVGWKATASGLTPGQFFSTQIEYWRRAYGVGSFTLYQTVTAGGSADGSGDLEITGDVPNDRGFETYAVAGACP